jgi:hypothetical protein
MGMGKGISKGTSNDEGAFAVGRVTYLRLRPQPKFRWVLLL